jgi:hypothetical protein
MVWEHRDKGVEGEKPRGLEKFLLKSHGMLQA